MRRAKRCASGLKVQSVVFPKAKWSRAEAQAWLRAHGYHGLAADEKASTLRYRQVDPRKCSMFRTISFGKNIKAVVCCRKRGA